MRLFNTKLSDAMKGDNAPDTDISDDESPAGSSPPPPPLGHGGRSRDAEYGRKTDGGGYREDPPDYQFYDQHARPRRDWDRDNERGQYEEDRRRRRRRRRLSRDYHHEPDRGDRGHRQPARSGGERDGGGGQGRGWDEKAAGVAGAAERGGPGPGPDWKKAAEAALAAGAIEAWRSRKQPDRLVRVARAAIGAAAADAFVIGKQQQQQGEHDRKGKRHAAESTLAGLLLDKALAGRKKGR